MQLIGQVNDLENNPSAIANDFIWRLQSSLMSGSFARQTGHLWNDGYDTLALQVHKKNLFSFLGKKGWLTFLCESYQLPSPCANHIFSQLLEFFSLGKCFRSHFCGMRIMKKQFWEKWYLIIDVFIVFAKVLRAGENSTRIYR